MKTTDLEDLPLRIMLAKALGYTFTVVPPEYGIGKRVMVAGHREYFRPDRDWAQCGVLIDKHWRETTSWLIEQLGPNWRDEVDGRAGSILVWFCRGIVGSVYGDEVNIDNEGVIHVP
jgi:hypothetical protein